jgi:hypothetical protein
VVWTQEVGEIVERFFSKVQGEVPESIARKVRQRVAMAIRAGGVVHLEPANKHRGPSLEIHDIGPDSGLERVGEEPVTTMYVIRGKGPLGHLGHMEGGYRRGVPIPLDWYGRDHAITAKLVGRGFAHRVQLMLPRTTDPGRVGWQRSFVEDFSLDASGQVSDPMHHLPMHNVSSQELARLVESMDPLMKALAQHITAETMEGQVVLGKVKPTGRSTGHPRNEAERQYEVFRKGAGRRPHSFAHRSNRGLPVRVKQGSRKRDGHVHH